LTLNVVVLISGSGSNLQALIDAAAEENSAFRISAVISNRNDAYGLQRATRADIETRVVPHDEFDNRDEYDRALMAAIDDCNPDLVALAGFMRILTDGFVRHYHKMLLNIHPSLLPKHKGLHTHRRAIEESADNLEEERRLFYVAITRAEVNLYMTSCRTRSFMRERIETVPSRFIGELPSHLLEQVAEDTVVEADRAKDFFSQLRREMAQKG